MKMLDAYEEKRKAQKRAAARKIRATKKANGYEGFACQIKPWMRKPLTKKLKELEAQDHELLPTR